jgi:hypothetical protein
MTLTYRKPTCPFGLCSDAHKPKGHDLRGHGQEILRSMDRFSGRFHGTYLESGLKLALKLLEKEATPEIVQWLYVLTDGQISDANACGRFTSYLRDLEVEVMSYGFGQDFEVTALHKIMDGCYGGGVKQIINTSMIRETFRHLQEVGASVVARDAEVRFIPAPGVILGDGFIHRPIRQKNFHMEDDALVIPLGMLEASRNYVLGIETRLPGEGGSSRWETCRSNTTGWTNANEDRFSLAAPLVRTSGEEECFQSVLLDCLRDPPLHCHRSANREHHRGTPPR